MHVSEGQLYAATVADFSGGEPLIHRDKIRTERSDLNQLNGKLVLEISRYTYAGLPVGGEASSRILREFTLDKNFARRV